METLLSSIDYKDPIWIAVAFGFGLFSRQVGLPPLVGFLIAGFTLNYLGAEGGEFLNEMADVGVTLLLFSIGLKLRVKELLRAEVWGVTLIHMLSIVVFLAASLFLLKSLQLPLFGNLDWPSILILSFALSFSSTVFVVKVLESRGDLLSQVGRLAIGVLIVQDIAAILFLGISEAKVPSLWAALLIVLLVAGRPLLTSLLEKIGHGELLVLYGLVLALGGAALFELVDMKGDLGALIFGVLIANHPKSNEMAKALFSLKELFLLGFFLSIGMAGLPDISMVFAVVILLAVLIVKSGLFVLLFSLFRVRSRPAAATSLILGNFSEFGLIVSVVAVSQQWLSQEWLVTMALLVSMSFIVSSVINNYSDDIYARFCSSLKKMQRTNRLEGDEDFDLSTTKVLVCGMGRVGTGAYDYLLTQGHKKVMGLDSDKVVVEEQCESGRITHFANVSNPDFWSRVDVNSSNIEWVFLCAPGNSANARAAK
ncbi:MAG: cation:proton antiporter, partial [Gammaproteobacteria bacterium]|nr:cation:proton antiporter [Gammaproteobacteria bacterium]